MAGEKEIPFEFRVIHRGILTQVDHIAVGEHFRQSAQNFGVLVIIGLPLALTAITGRSDQKELGFGLNGLVFGNDFGIIAHKRATIFGIIGEIHIRQFAKLQLPLQYTGNVVYTQRNDVSLALILIIKKALIARKPIVFLSSHAAL